MRIGIDARAAHEERGGRGTMVRELLLGLARSDADHRFDDPVKPVPWQGFTSRGPTVVGDNVWCGANVVITSGVTVGERCVIGANSVVTGELPDNCVAAGVPARVIKKLP